MQLVADYNGPSDGWTAPLHQGSRTLVKVVFHNHDATGLSTKQIHELAAYEAGALHGL